MKKYFKRILAMGLVLTTMMGGVPQLIWADEITTQQVETTVTEESATEEAVTEEAVTEEVTTEEIATEEVATEEMTTEEAVTEEAATEGTVTEENAGIATYAMEQDVTTPDAVNYVYVDQPYIAIGDTQNLVVSLGDEQTVLSDASLTLRRQSNNQTVVLSGAAYTGNAVRFTQTYGSEQDSDIYTIESMTYVKNGMQYTISFKEAGINTSYGVNKEVTTNPDAQVVTDEDSVDMSVVTIDQNGKQTSQNSISDAIASEQVDGVGGKNYKGNIVVVLDPGHDATHGGTHSASGLQEADLTLKIAKYCKDELETFAGVDVYMTRDSSSCPYPGTSSGDDNAKRVEYARSVGANIFVSIHLNSASDTNANGAEVFYPNGNYNGGASSTGASAATEVLKQLEALGLHNRGTAIKNRDTSDNESDDYYPDGSVADYYGVIRNSKLNGFAGIIIEHAFMSNSSDVSNYLSNENQLKALGMADAAGIAKSMGLSKGTTTSAIFDAAYYYLHYGDVAAAYGMDPAKLLWHFNNFGMAEGRQGCAEFNVQSYRNRYPDLRSVFGKDYKKYYEHYVNFGKAEGRIGTGMENMLNATTIYKGVDYGAVYDYNYYIGKYADVRIAFGDDENAVIEHFVKYGMAEGRQGNASFDVKSYRNQYTDLRRIYGSDLKSYYTHYMYYGRAEGRNGVGVTTLQNGTTVYNGVDYSPIYNYNYYISKYGDVRAAFGDDENKVIEHFVNCGLAEGRQGCASFDVRSYRNYYPDLRKVLGTDLKQFGLHYLNYGRYEGRKATGVPTLQNGTTVYNGIDYSPVYNYSYYVSQYGDVRAAFGDDENAVIAHFVNYGMAEGRLGCASFDVFAYRAKYTDLQAAYGTNWKSYYLHYLNYGRYEGRNSVISTGYASIIKNNSVSVAQMVNYYNSKTIYPGHYSVNDAEATSIQAFCQIYYNECEAEGVDVAIAFSQAMKETNFLRYGGDVKIGQYNFAGMGATGNGATGDSYNTVREGIRAHVQHLKAYAVKGITASGFANPVVDKRFTTWFSNNVSGSCPYVEWLGISENPSGKGWATESRYGYSILNNYMAELYKF